MKNTKNTNKIWNNKNQDSSGFSDASDWGSDLSALIKEAPDFDEIPDDVVEMLSLEDISSDYDIASGDIDSESFDSVSLVASVPSSNSISDVGSNRFVGSNSVPPASPSLGSLALILYKKPCLDLIVRICTDTADFKNNKTLDFKVTQRKFNWNSYNSNVQYSFLSQTELKEELEGFFSFYKKEYPKHPYFAIIFKLRFRNGLVRSCSTTQISTVEDFDKLLSTFSLIFFVENFADKVSGDEREIYEENSGLPTGKIMFDFKPMVTLKATKYEGLASLESDKDKILKEGKEFSKTLNYKGFKIPTHMDLTLWPNITFMDDYTHAHSIYECVDENNGKYYLDFNFSLYENHYVVTVSNRGKLLFNFTDKWMDRYDLTIFKRTIVENNKNTIYFYNSGKLLLYIEDKNTQFIEKIHKNSYISLYSIMTLDLETRNINGKLVPICMSIYDGKKTMSFLFKDSNNWQSDMEKALKNIMKRSYNYKKIYVHNFSYFDAIFMIDVLSKLGVIKPIMRDNKIIQLKFSFFTTNPKNSKKSSKPSTLIFYDSLLLLNASLNNLSKSFNIKNKKSVFPFDFVNSKDFSFSYNGAIPDYKYFPKAFTSEFTLDDYNDYCKTHKDKWEIEKELTKYCENDTIALHQIITKFAIEIFGLYKIDITKYPTLPSVAFAIYRSNFMPENTIPKILSKLHYTLKQSYYGGITDIYRPYGVNVNSYDVNSLYPSSMKNYPMPVGKPRLFSGNPYLLDKNPFGFFKVIVSAPNKKIPFLPTKIQSKNGQRMICPVGSWSGWYFSEEIKNAEKYGYKFKILEGYLFEKQIIFSEYVDELYKMKTEASPTNLNNNGDPVKYFIAKLLMNALYGRFGMNPISEENCIVSPEESEKIIMNHKNVKVVPLLSGNAFLTYDKLDDEDIDIADISVCISSAISAYSRIQMSYFMDKYSNNLYAMDTDGIKVDCHLHPSEIHNIELGKMKFEYTFKEGVFAAPKVYGGVLKTPYKNKKELTKVKGLKMPITYLQLKSVLNKDNPLKIVQEKWKRIIGESSILINLESYTLSLTENKRELIFNSWGDLVDTVPIYLKDGKIVKRNLPLLYYLGSPKTYLPLPEPDQFLYIMPPKQLLSLPVCLNYERELDIIYVLPEIIYMKPPLPPIIYLWGKIQECLPPLTTRLSLPAPLSRVSLPAPAIFPSLSAPSNNKEENNTIFDKLKPSGGGRASQKIEVFDKETNITTTYDSMATAGRALGIRWESIKNYFYRNQQKPYKGRYTFKKL